MKTIYLIRHAKSSWSSLSLNDFDRPLNERGKKDAPFIGKKLKELRFNPDEIRSSPSKRTTKTIKLICKEVDFDFKNVVFKKELFHPSLTIFKSEINSLSDTINSVAFVSHNFGISDFGNYLTDNAIGVMPTCGVVKINIDIDTWQELIEGLGTLEYYVYPKMKT
ncbi:MAG: phosphohistidine phosphatase [Bacteroidetes bacterium HGW-Bacteroidetes-12]|nr:MAG: phosphohistidine phosphatase [Bacteroidetes bacterium HGW-Bacteroidetes-12]